jgi:hypothetical protein
MIGVEEGLTRRRISTSLLSCIVREESAIRASSLGEIKYLSMRTMECNVMTKTSYIQTPVWHHHHNSRCSQSLSKLKLSTADFRLAVSRQSVTMV